MKTTKTTLLLALALALALALPALPAAAQADFSKFVVVGASVDAGFLDSCWVKHGQVDSWPAILARQAGNTGLQQPILGEPGLGPCPIRTSKTPRPGCCAALPCPKRWPCVCKPTRSAC